jgi:hypothetical protein
VSYFFYDSSKSGDEPKSSSKNLKLNENHSNFLRSINISVEFGEVYFPGVPVFYQSVFQRFLVPNLFNPGCEDVVFY